MAALFFSRKLASLEPGVPWLTGAKWQSTGGGRQFPDQNVRAFNGRMLALSKPSQDIVTSLLGGIDPHTIITRICSGLASARASQVNELSTRGPSATNTAKYNRVNNQLISGLEGCALQPMTSIVVSQELKKLRNASAPSGRGISISTLKARRTSHHPIKGHPAMPTHINSRFRHRSSLQFGRFFKKGKSST